MPSVKQLSWQQTPREAARLWLTQHREKAFAEHSIAQYSAMVGTAADWLQEKRGQDLLSCTGVDLNAFFKGLMGRGGKPASAATLKRYRSLLDLLFEHLAGQALRSGNPMDSLTPQAAWISPVRQAPRFLSDQQSEAYIQWTLKQPRQLWHECRDAALRLIYLASGVTVEESLALKLRHLVGTSEQLPWLQIDARSSAQQRRLPLPSWSQVVMREWQQQRAHLPVFSDVLFPGRKRMRRESGLGLEATESPISTSELYETIRPAMLATGFQGEQLGPQTLRNTWAVRQLAAGIDPAQVQRWMGLRTSFSIEALLREMQGLTADDGPQPV